MGILYADAVAWMGRGSDVVGPREMWEGAGTAGLTPNFGALRETGRLLGEGGDYEAQLRGTHRHVWPVDGWLTLTV